MSRSQKFNRGAVGLATYRSQKLKDVGWVDGGNPKNCLNKQQHLTKIGICWVARSLNPTYF
ncbi:MULTISPECIES: hypothetical protein [Okeania]|uniref:Uncharacterized protein n=1 Tax=Okeania hirsuta TaxID=1458930 RepID=A0A3N6N8S6_9CYAN|nr:MULTISPECIES: hypothetical protein [Okeania]NEP03607.1 hypothetical protein [Okeania sp. SIO4D6]NEQ93231.1 hypothetical protein [Okeania sp. SIO2G4]NEP72467.1 hypothetical protein [Okeania sp. SIO2G5]NEP93128.1 hypothetical protein [Okeania sp. SIO2F5]NES78648.1 hypothetical protein [Okeania sp. SIO1H4]